MAKLPARETELPVTRARAWLVSWTAIVAAPGVGLAAWTGLSTRHPATLLVFGLGLVPLLGTVGAIALDRAPIVSMRDSTTMRHAIQGAVGRRVHAARLGHTRTGRAPRHLVVVEDGEWLIWEGLAGFARPDAADALVVLARTRRARRHTDIPPRVQDYVAAAIEASPRRTRAGQWARERLAARSRRDRRPAIERRAAGRRALEALRFGRPPARPLAAVKPDPVEVASSGYVGAAKTVDKSEPNLRQLLPRSFRDHAASVWARGREVPRGR